MTVTQASAVWELHHANPTLGRRQLYVAGFRIGRDHIASTVNTLVLAYAGASMPLLVLLVLSRQSVTSVANSELATEIVRRRRHGQPPSTSPTAGPALVAQGGRSRLPTELDRS